MNADSFLRDALNRVYETFAGVPRPKELQACPHCRDGKAIYSALTSVSLRDVAAKDIGPYSGWAMTTVGGSEDYRYFLPRILELAVIEPDWMGTSPYVIASRLTMAHWEAWTEAQQSAVKRVFEAAFFNALGSDLEISARDWLCGLARLSVPLDASLDMWRARQDAPAICQLAWFAITVAKNVSADGVLSDSTWDETIPASTKKQVGTWLRSEATRAQIASNSGKLKIDDEWMIAAALASLS